MNTTSACTALLLCLALAARAADAEMEFSGRYEYRTDQESRDIIGRQVCFYPSGPSAHAVPRPAGDRRLAWFCFSNSEAAAKMLGFSLAVPAKACGLRGSATVTVGDYARYTREGDGNDLARLTAVLRKTRPETLPCTE